MATLDGVSVAHIDGALGLLNAAQAVPDAAKKGQLVSLSSFVGSRECCGSNGLAEQLLREDPARFNKAIRLLEGVGLEAAQAANNIGHLDFPRWRQMLGEARQSIQNAGSLTVAQSRANAAPIEDKQAALAAKIKNLQAQAARRVDPLKDPVGTVLASFNPMSNAQTAAMYSEISRLINSTDLLAADKERLSTKQRQLLGQHGQMTSAFNKDCGLQCVLGQLWEKYKYYFIGGAILIGGGIPIAYGFGSGIGRGLIKRKNRRK